MKTTGIESLKNIEVFMKKEHKGLWGMMQGNTSGAIAKILTKDRFYFMTIIVDDDLDKVFLDIHPQSVCEEPYRQMVHGYLNAHTSTYKSGRIDIDDDSGEVKIRMETQISDHPVSVADLKDMEYLAVNISDGLERRLDKLCHGVWFNEDDPELMGNMERQRKKMIERLKKKASLFDDDDEDEDDDLSDIGFDDNSDEDEDNNDDDDDASSGLSELLKLLESMKDDDDGTNEPIEAEYSDQTEQKEKTYRIELIEVPSHVDTDELVKALEQTLGMSREETVSATEKLPCCIAESVSASDSKAIKIQLNHIGVKIRIEKNSD